jgi:hypothetical protein
MSSDADYKVNVDIEKGEATFKVDLVGQKSKESYKGVFVVRCMLNPMAFIAADKLYRELLGGKPVEAHPHAGALAFALSQLKYRVLKMPPFWENREIPGGHIDDHNILIEVLNRAIYCEEVYAKMKNEEAVRIEKELTDDIFNKIIERQPELESMGESEAEVETDGE